MMHTLKISTPTDREIAMTRVFDAPRQLVWDAMTRPDLLKRWMFGPEGWAMTVCDSETRVGGAIHCAWSGPAGEAMSVRGVYREVVPPKRMVRTESFEFGCESQAGEQLATLVLTEEAERTYLTLTILYPSKEARDATLASGMEHGVAAGYDRLEAILAATN
jgi:uncharacterized protein YndB with AHSA1/START domain